MSRRKPYDSLHTSEETSRRPAVWRSLDEKYSSERENRTRAEAELPGGFMKGLVGLGSLKKKLGKSAPSAEQLLAAQPKVSRRGFLAGTTAAAALTLPGCARRPVENIVPYVEGPEYQLPGIPIHFASVTQRGSDAIGLLVTSHEGRPTKIEGNPRHGRSLGATDLRAQLAIWDLYNPDRSQSPAKRDGDALVDATFAEFDEAFTALMTAHQRTGGTGLRVLMPPTNSPSVLRVREALSARLPQAKFHHYTSVDEDNVREGTRMAFGQPLSPIYNLAAADVILALDSDFLGTEPGSVRNVRAFASRRRITDPETQRMNRLYSVEATHSVTGASADHRVRMPAQDIEGFLQALAGQLGGGLPAAASSTEGYDADFIAALAADLQGARGRSIIMVGRRQPPRVHALAHAINEALGAVGAVVAYQTVTDALTSGPESLAELVSATDVETLLVLGGNPVYDAPADLDIAGLLARDGVTSIHLSESRDETTERCSWHVPMAHELETWGDQRAADGAVAIQQPLIQPIWGGRSPLELLAKAAGERNWRGHYVVRKTFRERFGGGAGFDSRWRQALHIGVIAGSMTRPVRPALQPAAIATAFAGAERPEAVGANNFEIIFAPAHHLFDGRYSNNLWALEAPDPMTKLVWDNAAIMSKGTMDELGLRDGAMVRLAKGDAQVELPAYALPGHADHSITLNLGWGRTAAGRYGSVKEWDGLGPGLGIERSWMSGGFDVQPLRSSDGFYFTNGVSVTATGDDYWLVTTQNHDFMEGRPIAIDATVDEYRAEPEFASYRTVEMNVPPLWEQVDYSPHEVATGRTLHKWGMVIDLSTCVGCNACSVACQAENNIPAVGKQETARGRHMSWLRIDRYFIGTDDEPAVALQPIGCQHCEEAPCENVCPVNATVHSPEGLNDMAYNRCIGTRYCANNCPYKVRRFNYLDWHSHLDDPWTMHGNFPNSRKLQFNPNVTVRMRGVMEKCSYCTQRIQEAGYAAHRDHREIRDGDIVTACQQVCPAEAIVFGDLNDPESRVSKADEINRRYKLLAEIGTRPRTTFLGKIRNPNPALESETDSHSDSHEGEAH